jgi:hypothetical protein
MQAAGPGRWPGACGWGSGDAMNAVTANAPEAAGLVTLARIAGEPAKMIAAAPRHGRQQLAPALLGVG